MFFFLIFMAKIVDNVNGTVVIFLTIRLCKTASLEPYRGVVAGAGAASLYGFGSTKLMRPLPVPTGQYIKNTKH
jgi:hypothetical protein